MSTSLAALGLLLAFLAIYAPIRLYLSFRRNLLAARASGIPYTCIPLYPNSVLAQVMVPLCKPLLRLIHRAFPGPWLEYQGANYNWMSTRKLFRQFGSSSVFLVCCDKLILVTSDPDVITQITTRRNDFPKPMEIYQSLAIYGHNVVTLEGADWRRHRRATMPQFGESNNRAVWKESIFQAGEMLKHWTRNPAAGRAKQETGNSDSKSWTQLVQGASHDCMRLSLYVISRAGFGVRCQWPGDEHKAPGEKGVISATEVPKGRSMSYMGSMETLLENILPLFALPMWSLDYLPFNAIRIARDAYREWGMYMDDIFKQKQEEAINSTGSQYEGMDLMGALIKQSGHIPGIDNFEKSEFTLTKEEILGNSFIMFLAGHETAANSIHFTLLFLAARPMFQQKLQKELDVILGDREPSEWTYDVDLPKLFAGMLGAVMNEELRVIAPVVFLPKHTLPGKLQHLNINGKDVVLPTDTLININTVRTHRNPEYWPYLSSDPDDVDDRAGDLETFKPERWLAKKPGPHASFDTAPETNPTTNHAELASSISSATNDTLDSSSDTASTLFHPAKGAYIPFSMGARSCLGRRFAQVEILAVLAVILRAYSVELSTDAYADPRELENMEEDEKRRVWEQARAEMERKVREEADTLVTLQLRGEGVDIKLRRRGREVFSGWEESDVYVSGAKLR